MYYVFIACVAVGLWTVWEGSALQWSGLIALALGVLAWAFGRVVGREIFANNASARYLMIAMAGILTLQLGVSAAQLLGLEVPSWLTGTDRTLEGLIGRASGTVGHPANLAKIAFITCLIALPFTLSKGRKVRFWAWTVVGLGLVTSGLTISRANLAAHFLLIGLWIVTLPGKARFMVRLASGVALAVLALIFLPPLLERFEMDETGGQRPVLLDAAWMQLSQNLWTGTGPNSYISVVGGFDAATASGLPVHNAFLLYTAELGLTLAVVFYAPILLLLLRSLRRAGRRGSQLSAAKVLVFALPGYLMITLTGWSLMANFSLVATMLTFGILDAAVPKRGTQRSERRAREDSHGASPMSEESSRANEDHGKRMAAL
ncbi:hypothetical protein GCM10022377_08850 [Zhihengliuella alba]|uniref:O-antigen ligase family protein n=2 Tax=Zhihengliuella alba TaxID=547018 RepID=A0ABP7D1G9_9MICC